MKQLIDYLKESSVLKRLDQALKHEKTIEITDTFTMLNAFLIHYVIKHTNRNVLIVNHNLYHAQKTFDLLNNTADETLGFFPQDEFITTDMLAMSEDFKFERLNAIKSMIDQDRNIVLTNPSGLVKTLWPQHFYKEVYQTYKVGDTLDIEAFKQRLIHLGYEGKPEVEKVGDFASRGSIIDVFLSDEPSPIRIDFFDDEVDSLRYFDLKTQRSKQKTDRFTLFPRTEFFYSERTLSHIEATIEEKKKKIDLDEVSLSRIDEELEQLRNYENQDQLSRYMSFTGEKLETILDYLNDPLIIKIESEKIGGAYTQLVRDLEEWLTSNGTYPRLEFDFIKDMDRLYAPTTIMLNTFKSKTNRHFSMPLRAKESMQYENNMHMLIKDLKKYENYVTVLMTISDKERLKTLMETLEEHVDVKLLGPNDRPFKKKINIQHSDNPLTFEWFDTEFVLLNEENIYKETRKKPGKRTKKVFKDSETIRNVESLKKGDYIVHYDYGIGRFLGVETMEVGEQINDYIVIGYKGDDTLYIPVENVHLIQRYNAHEGIKPRLNKIGSPEWAKTKRRVRKKAKDIARHLIDLYAKREQAEGFAFSPDSDLMTEFEADFGYEETDDQLKAIEAVKQDMEKPIPMDRLICGDVGYGKTEVAMRAAFKAVLDNKQVLYLAPTTILSRQHYYTFKSRMEKHGIKVALLNRFVRPAKQKEYIRGIEDGSVDIVIGTHRLLSKDVNMKDLGLLIVDEEQRFGVQHKEKIKAMKLHVDVLSLSATPIPRTLQMAMTGVKQMSLIETPPKNRFPIQTYVLRRNDHVIQDAIEREIGRGGQVFYLYNRVEKIDAVRDELERLVPDARIAYAHGQMSRQKLESVMRDFLDHEFDVLLSTTIIETGIDIPNANTLIIHDADRLGLSQLYQIRGRVGRSDRIAYSYLMYEKNKQLKDEATKRLQAIKEFTELGSGYKIASRDLAIRGAGDLLGTEQSGYIDSVGIDLFMEILKEEIEKGKEKEKEQPEAREAEKTEPDTSPNIKLPTSRTIPDAYISDDDTKIELHKRFNRLESSNDYLLLKEEMEDRYGEIPDKVRNYMLEKLYERLATNVGVEKVRQTKTETIFTLTKSASKNIHGEMIFTKTSELSRHIHLDYRQEKLHIKMEKVKLEKPVVEMIIPILESIG